MQKQHCLDDSADALLTTLYGQIIIGCLMTVKHCPSHVQYLLIGYIAHPVFATYSLTHNEPNHQFSHPSLQSMNVTLMLGRIIAPSRHCGTLPPTAFFAISLLSQIFIHSARADPSICTCFSVQSTTTPRFISISSL